MSNVHKAITARYHLQQALKKLRSFQMTCEQVSEMSEEMEIILDDIKRELETLKV